MFKRNVFITLHILILMMLVCLSGCDAKPAIQVPKSRKEILSGLRKEHPRLLFTMTDQRRIEKLVTNNPLLAEMIVQLKHNAERMLNEPVLAFKRDSRFKRRVVMLYQSRICLARVLTLSMAYRLTGDLRFAKRAIGEMLAAAKFKTWNPSHFLDTAEMCCALAIGYDWLYDVLSVTDRAEIRRAIVAKALKPGIRAYLNPKKSGWWTIRHNNWNQVCNAGLTLGALAVAEDEQELSGKIITHALRSICNAMDTYQPDGAWYEGPMYWTYGTTFNGLMIAALDSALGNDFGLSEKKGFADTGLFRSHMVRPNTKWCFNYADARARLFISPIMFWLSRKYNRPAYAWSERQRMQSEIERHKQQNGRYRISYHHAGRLYVMSIAWFDERGERPSLPLDAFFRKAHVVAMRSAWGDKNALYVGFKGGDNTVSHAHMDIGSFVLDANAVPWALDLGADKYSLRGYHSRSEKSRRWRYYRCNSKGHNTLVIGGKNQRVKGSESKVINFLSTPDRAHAIVDMSNAYKGQAKKVLRGIAMLDRAAVLIQDEITEPMGKIRWGMVTPADIKLDGARAILTKNGKTMRVEILSPAGAKFKILSTTPPTKQESRNEGTFMLAFSVKPAAKKNLRLAVLLTPVSDRRKKISTPQIKPLSEWVSQASCP